MAGVLLAAVLLGDREMTVGYSFLRVPVDHLHQLGLRGAAPGDLLEGGEVVRFLGEEAAFESLRMP